VTESEFLQATRLAYDTIADDYGAKFGVTLTGIPFEHAMLAVFAELVREGGGGPVVDVGCGPGYWTAHLNSLGLNAFGVDLSPAMVAFARRTYPALRFDEGSMTALDLADGSVAGVTAFYSTIHIPTWSLGGVFAGFWRVLRPGGHVLLAFQRGDEHRHRTESFGRKISLDYYLREPEVVASLLTAAGFEPVAQLTREPTPPDEKVPRAFLLMRKPLAP